MFYFFMSRTLRKLCRKGRAPHMMEPISRNSAYNLLLECNRKKNLQNGRYLKSLILQSGLDSLELLGNHLIRLFASCKCLVEAIGAFDKVMQPSSYTWTAIISAHTSVGQEEAAIQLYKAMQMSGMKGYTYVYLAGLKACSVASALELGRLIHNEVIEYNLELDVVMGSSFIHMYSKCGALEESRNIFECLPNRNLVCWGAMIAAYVQHNQGKFAFGCYIKMKEEGIKPDKILFSSALKACGSIGALEHGRHIHHEVIKSGLQVDAVMGSTLVDMYVKCECVEEARDVFDRLEHRDIFTWNAMVAGYVHDGKYILAFELFEEMQGKGIKPDSVTLSSILKACAITMALEQGRYIHHQIIENGLKLDAVLGTALIDMYAKGDSLEESTKMFDQVIDQTVVSWNAMIAGYAHHGEGNFALNCYKKMQEEGTEPNNITFSSLLYAYGRIGAINEARLIHHQVLDQGYESDLVVGATLIDVYAKCGSLEESYDVFNKLPYKDDISWDAMIGGYAHNCESHFAIDCFSRMLEERIKPSKVTFLSMLKVCGHTRDAEQCRLIHGMVLEYGFERDTVLGNALVDIYAKCSCLEESQKVFDKLENRDVVSWNAIIAGYAQQEEGIVSLCLFEVMQAEGVEPNDLTFSCALKACASIGTLSQGTLIHKHIRSQRIESDIVIKSTLIDMYAKCGSLERSREVFNNLTSWNVVSWSAMIAAYAQHGEGTSALECFKKMQEEGIKPNKITFLSILIACSRAGLQDEGYWYFTHMADCHGIMADTDHYNSVVDLLCRAGYLDEGKDLLQAVESPSISGWICLLSACNMHANVELGKQCFDEVICLAPDHGPAYVLMSNLYSEQSKKCK